MIEYNVIDHLWPEEIATVNYLTNHPRKSLQHQTPLDIVVIF